MSRHRTRVENVNSSQPAISLALMVMGVLACQTISYAQRSESRRSEPDPRAPLTPELAAQLSQNADHSVTVIMKSKVAGDRAAADQAPLMDELRQVKAAGIKPFRLVNAFAATVSEGELARLKIHPAVERVLPDVVIRRKPRASPLTSPRVSTAASASSTASPRLVPAVLNNLPGACSSSAQGLLDPEALPLTNTASDDPIALTARSLGFTGAGVKVAAMADGVDVNNFNFIRANGTSAFIDYRDFSGDGPTAPTFGGAAFVDYNAIAGQGIQNQPIVKKANPAFTVNVDIGRLDVAMNFRFECRNSRAASICVANCKTKSPDGVGFCLRH